MAGMHSLPAFDSWYNLGKISSGEVSLRLPASGQALSELTDGFLKHSPPRCPSASGKDSDVLSGSSGSGHLHHPKSDNHMQVTQGVKLHFSSAMTLLLLLPCWVARSQRLHISQCTTRSRPLTLPSRQTPQCLKIKEGERRRETEQT